MISARGKIVVYILAALILGTVIVTELILPKEVGFEAVLRVLVITGAVFLIAFFILTSPATLTGRKRRTDKTGQPLFQIRHKGASPRPDDADASESGPRRLFKIVYKKDNAPAPPVRVNAPARMFGTAGVRGVTNTEITPLLVIKMAQGYGDLLRETFKGDRITVAVGYDSRYGSEMLVTSAASGLMSAGINVVGLGCVPTGAIACYIVKHNLAGGVLITGSHMPYNMTGLIILKSDGSYLDDDIARDLEKRFAEYGSRTQVVPPESIGKLESKQALEIYRDFILSKVDNGLIKSKKYRVLVDPANGPAALVLPELLRQLGCEVFLTNEQILPVPKRPAEPRASNLSETAAKVTENKCDLGIATDVDADRVLFIDTQGQVPSEDVVGAIFARSILGNKGLCVTPINSSNLIEQVVADCGAQLCYCPIGQPATLKVVREKKADFSYEESGKYYFSRDVLWPDGILASVKLLEIMARRNKPLAELASEFPVFYQVKHTVPCPSSLKDTLMAEITKLWSARCSIGRDRCTAQVTLDGLKTVYEDKAWLLIRKSGTEPLIRVYADASSKERAAELVKAGEQIVQEALAHS
ncbi:MAG: phosphoglucomutase [Planctomycetes bacterium]|nr:phosphoglucomutase [Planctomycetota bacterium]